MPRLVVIGGGAAGMSAASSARRVDPGLEIVVIEATGFAAWGLCGIPYYVSGLVAHHEDLISIPPKAFRRERHIDLRLHTRALSLDAESHTLVVQGPDRDEERLEYDKLVLAAGAAPAKPPIPGLDHPRVFGVRALEDAIALRKGIADGVIRRCLVVGGGDIGLEMAEALAARDCSVIVVDLEDRVMPKLDAKMAAEVEKVVRSHVELRLVSRLDQIHIAGERLRCQMEDGEDLEVDAVILATGVRPGAEIVASAGAVLGAEGAVEVDDRMRTSLPDVFAAGDCVAVHHRVLDRSAYVPLGPTANRTGRVAGMTAAGAEASFGGVVGTSVAKIFDLTVATTGLTVEQARANGFPAEATDSVSASKARYYPGSVPTHIRLVHTPGGALLGAQMVSADPATAKRIDVVATALTAGLGISGLLELDLSYAPPYAPVYDPILRAAQAVGKTTTSAT